MAVSFNGEFNTLIIFHTDQKGVIADVSSFLARNDINIAFMKLYRLDEGSDAITVIETDQRVENYYEIRNIKGVKRVVLYEKPDA